jgi:UMF1 family MFS transporter
MATSLAAYSGVTEHEYKRRIWAWTMYDWANSAFATTILAAVLPIYFSQVAGATLPSAATATAYWGAGLSISLLIIALLSPILGTISDVMRGKKRFLAIFAGIGIVSTALLVLVSTGDWVLASIFGILGRIGFNGANSFYDALLPHVAREADRDAVSARGYAMGYLGGGLLLAVNIVMIQALPGTWGPRLSFLSVALWWAVFSIPLFTRIPEPPAATARQTEGESVVAASFKRLGETMKDIRQYGELFKFLVSFLIYNDGIGTIIGVAAIYGAELGFGSVELILALLLVQFVGIPYSLIFGRLPSRDEKRRPFYLAFVLFNLIALPLAGIAGTRLLPAQVTGMPPAPFASTASAAGQGVYAATDARLNYTGVWRVQPVSAEILGTQSGAVYRQADGAEAQASFAFNGQRVRLVYSTDPQGGIWGVNMDGQPLLDEDSGQPLTLDTYNPTVRYGVEATFAAAAPGEHNLAQPPEQPGGSHRGDRGRAIGGVAAGVDTRPAPVHPAGRGYRYAAGDNDRLADLCGDCGVGLHPELGDRVLVPGLDGLGGAGGQPGAEPQPVLSHVAGFEERRVLRPVWGDGEVLSHYRPAGLRLRGG